MTEVEIIQREGRRRRRGGKGKAVLLVELSGRSVGRQGVGWQESGTATQLFFCVEGPPRLVSLYFIVTENKRE